MFHRLIAAAALATLAVSPALAQETKVVTKQVIKTADGREVAPDSPEAKAMAQCGGRSFVANAEVGEGTAKRQTRIKLCAKQGETDAAWIATLEKASVKLQAMDEISADSRTKIAAQIDAEVARLKAGK